MTTLTKSEKKAIESIKKRLGKKRDELRDILAELEELVVVGESAREGLDDVICNLSTIV